MFYERLTFEEYQELFKKIHAELKKPFPPGTLTNRENKEKAKYIPVQAYIHRLNNAAAGVWSWKKESEVVIHENEKELEVTGQLKILDQSVSASGFAKFTRDEKTKRIVNLRYVIQAAHSDALRNACDLLEMGWKDLASYRDWGENPGVGLSNTNIGDNNRNRVCILCHEDLSHEDIMQLENYDVRIDYCQIHIPGHLKRPRGKDKRQK